MPMVADAPWDITHPRRPVLPPLPMTAIMDEYVHSGAVRPVAKGKGSSPTFTPTHSCRDRAVLPSGSRQRLRKHQG